MLWSIFPPKCWSSFSNVDPPFGGVDSPSGPVESPFGLSILCVVSTIPQEYPPSIDSPSRVSILSSEVTILPPEYWFPLPRVHSQTASNQCRSSLKKNTNIFIWNQIRRRNRKLLSQLRRWMFFLKQFANGEDSFPFNMKTHGAAVPCPSFSPATLSSGERSTACQWPDPHTSLQVVSWSRLRAGWLSVLIYILAKCFSG